MDGEWDYHLEEEAARIGCEVRSRRAAFAAPPGIAPVFLSFDGGEARPIHPRKIARICERTPSDSERDQEFLRELRRTDHPSGSFFVMVWRGQRHQWSYYA